MNPFIKKCSKCGELKDANFFYHRSDKPHLLQSRCIGCIIIDRREFRNKNIERFKQKDKNYHLKNREKRIKYLRSWQANNREYIRAMFNKKIKEDTSFALRSRIHNRIRMALKRNSKYSTSENYLGCNINQFKIHFERLFKNGMTWDDFLKGNIHIDHIIPCSKFDLSDINQQKICFNYKNLQPLWWYDNLKKNNKTESEVCYC